MVIFGFALTYLKFRQFRKLSRVTSSPDQLSNHIVNNSHCQILFGEFDNRFAKKKFQMRFFKFGCKSSYISIPLSVIDSETFVTFSRYSL